MPSLFLSCYGMIQMYTYENVNFLLGFKSGEKMTSENFFIPFFTGGLSKCIASAVLMPINVVRLRLQMKKYSTQQVEDMGLKIESNTRQQITYDGIWDCVRKIKGNEGLRGFYKGITPNLLRIFPTSGLFFIVYEYTLLALQKHNRE
jgi:solute carrier family 25 folate transporter 32